VTTAQKKNMPNYAKGNYKKDPGPGLGMLQCACTAPRPIMRAREDCGRDFDSKCGAPGV
jgi:hypothetical protein